ncbi:MAG: hypothetical protein WC509_07540 [Candidatus Izemoplasmatales bacterium]
MQNLTFTAIFGLLLIGIAVTTVIGIVVTLVKRGKNKKEEE